MRAITLLLAVALAVALAGCGALGSPATRQPTATATPAPVPQPPASASASGPASATATTDSSLSSRSYPARPVTLTRTAAAQFAVAYERSLGWNRRLSNRTVDLHVTVVRSSVRRDAGGYVVRVEVGVSETVRRDGARAVEEGYYTAAYLVNETTVMRAAVGGDVDRAPDPREGTVLRPRGGRSADER